MKQSTEIKFDINTFDIDIAGHVNNAVYIHWLEILRTKLFAEHFNLKRLLKMNIYPVVVSTTIEYNKYLKLFDNPVGIMTVDKTEHGMIFLSAKITAENKTAASSMQKCILLKLNTAKALKGSEVKEILNHIKFN